MASLRAYLPYFLALVMSHIGFDIAMQAAQDPGTSATAQPAQQEQDPLQRPRPAKKRDKKKDESAAYKRWIEQEVPWIITPEERSAFMKLTNNAERDRFIEIFWQHRDPTPDTEENEYKDSYFRRLAYANDHFAAGIPGWKTDRGHVYILHGAPDSIDAHPAGGPYQRPMEEGGGETQTHPFEIWRYRNLDGVGQEVELEFVDSCDCGDYHLTLNRAEKDALLNVPGAGPTLLESLGMSTKVQRFSSSIETLGPSPFNQGLQSKEFDRMETMARVLAPPPIRSREPFEYVKSTIRYNILPFDYQVDFVKASADLVLTPVTIKIPNRNITFVNKDGVQRGSLSIYGRVTNLTGKIIQSFEDPVRVDVPADLLEKVVERVSLYQKVLPLPPGQYRLDLIIKDVNGTKAGYAGQRMDVPDFSAADKLTSSSLILADVLEPASRTQVGSGAFVLGPTRVRPRVGSSDGKPATFKANEQVNLWMQVYHLSLDPATEKPSATVQFKVIDNSSGHVLIDDRQATEEMGNIKEQLTLEKKLPIGKLPPGSYQVSITVSDRISGATISPSAKFIVE